MEARQVAACGFWAGDESLESLGRLRAVEFLSRVRQQCVKAA